MNQTAPTLRSSRLGLALALSTLTAVVVAGPIAYQAVNARNQQVALDGSIPIQSTTASSLEDETDVLSAPTVVPTTTETLSPAGPTVDTDWAAGDTATDDATAADRTTIEQTTTTTGPTTTAAAPTTTAPTSSAPTTSAPTTDQPTSTTAEPVTTTTPTTAPPSTGPGPTPPTVLPPPSDPHPTTPDGPTTLAPDDESTSTTIGSAPGSNPVHPDTTATVETTILDPECTSTVSIDDTSITATCDTSTTTAPPAPPSSDEPDDSLGDPSAAGVVMDEALPSQDANDEGAVGDEALDTTTTDPSSAEPADPEPTSPASPDESIPEGDDGTSSEGDSAVEMIQSPVAVEPEDTTTVTP